MENKDALIYQIREILLRDSVAFVHGNSNFLSRLINMTKLQQLMEKEQISEECGEIILQGLEKIKELSPKLKEWIFSKAQSENWRELNLLKFMLLHQNSIELLRDYPYVIAYEWEVSPSDCLYTLLHIYKLDNVVSTISMLPNNHKGDLVLMDENYNFLVVEVKYIDNESSGRNAKNNRTKQRKQVREQAEKYVCFFEMMFPWLFAKGLAFTNELLREELSMKFKNYR